MFKKIRTTSACQKLCSVIFTYFILAVTRCTIHKLSWI